MIYTNEEYKYLMRKGIDPNLFRKTYQNVKKIFGSDSYITSAEVIDEGKEEQVVLPSEEE
jgi:hypothetical protein